MTALSTAPSTPTPNRCKRNRSIALDYPKGIIKKAGGKRVKVNQRVYKEGTDRLLRLANCIIPRTPQAVNMLNGLILKGVKNIRQTNPRNAAGKTTASEGAGPKNCTDGDPTTPDTMPILEINGDDDAGGSDGGGGSGPNDPPDGDDPGSGDPGGGGPCYSCDPGGEPEEDPCQFSTGSVGFKDGNGDGTLSCEQEEPCDTGVPEIDNPAIQSAMKKLWEDSNYGPDSNPNPESQRKEQGGFIVPDGSGGYVFQGLQASQITKQTPCMLGFKIDPSTIPAGAIYVHSHPYTNSEKQYNCNTPRPVEYRNHVGVKDRPALRKMGVDKGIILDANEYTFYKANGTDPNGYDKEDRCGY